MKEILCSKCKKVTEHRHLHDSPYGMAGAHMSGTERYECQVCGRGIYADEGVKLGLVFFYDKPYNSLEE